MTSLPGLRLPDYVDAIDVSRVQVVEDADAVRAAGFLAAWAKASEGLGYCDPEVQEHLRRLSGAGVITSVYAFARVQQGDPAAQARKAFACAGDVYQTRVMLDLESAPKEWGSVQLCDFAEGFFDGLDAEGGGGGTFYTYTSFLAERLHPEIARRPKLIAKPLHLAEYRSLTASWAPTAASDLRRRTAPWGDWTALQYSGNAGFRVPGIVGDCDRNLVRAANVDELRAFFGLPPEGTTLDMGGPVHGTHVVDAALRDRDEREPIV